MDALIDSFISESDEMLHEITALLDNMEHVVEQEKVEKVFKLVHTIKDTSELFDCPHITALCHAFEKSIYKVLSGSHQPDKRSVSLFLKISAVLRRMISEIEPGEHVDVKPLIEALSTIQNNKSAFDSINDSQQYSIGDDDTKEDITTANTLSQDNISVPEKGAELIAVDVNEDSSPIAIADPLKREDDNPATDEMLTEGVSFENDIVEIVEPEDEFDALCIETPTEETEGFKQNQVVEYIESPRTITDDLALSGAHEDGYEQSSTSSVSCETAQPGEVPPLSSVQVEFNGIQALDDSQIEILASEDDESMLSKTDIEKTNEDSTETIIVDSSSLVNLVASDKSLLPEYQYDSTKDDIDLEQKDTVCFDSEANELPETIFSSGGVFLNYLAGTLDKLEDTIVRLETAYQPDDLRNLKNSFYTIYCGGTHFSETIGMIANSILCLITIIEQRRDCTHFIATDALLHACELIRNSVYGEKTDFQKFEELLRLVPYFEETYESFKPQNPEQEMQTTVKKVQVPEKYIRYATKHNLHIVQLTFSLRNTNASTIIDRINAAKKVEILKSTVVDENTLYVFTAMAVPSTTVSPNAQERSILFSPETADADDQTLIPDSKSPLLKEALFTYMQKGTDDGAIIGVFDEMIQLSAASGIESVKLIERIQLHNEQLMSGDYQL